MKLIYCSARITYPLQEEVRKLEEEWGKVNEQLNAITEEGKKLGGQQEAICNVLKQKKNIYREKQVL